MNRIQKQIHFIEFPGGATVKLWTQTVHRGQASKTIYIGDQKIGSWDSEVGIATGYELDDRGVGV
jgi:hypothetical protein